MRKHLLRAGSWLDDIKISLSQFQPHLLKPQLGLLVFSLVLPHFRLNKHLAGVMNGAGEAGLLEIVRSEVRLPYLEPFVTAPLNDLLTHILNCHL
jgi:hypothetical protein